MTTLHQEGYGYEIRDDRPSSLIRRSRALVQQSSLQLSSSAAAGCQIPDSSANGCGLYIISLQLPSYNSIISRHSLPAGRCAQRNKISRGGTKTSR